MSSILINFSRMQTLISSLGAVVVDVLKRQAFSVIILVVAVSWFGYRDHLREAKVEDLHDQMLSYLNSDRSVLQSALVKNTEVLEDVEQRLAVLSK